MIIIASNVIIVACLIVASVLTFDFGKPSLKAVTSFSYEILKKKNFMAPFCLWMGLNCLKAIATSRRQFTFYHSVPRNSWYSFYQPQKDERLS